MVVNISNRIKNIQELAEVLTSVRAEGNKVIQCHGVFDLLHIGHIRHFEQAKSMGDVLVVTITPDHYVNKGPHRPAFTASLRAEAVAALDCVDYVAINEWPTAVESIRLLRPDAYVKGREYAESDKDLTGGITEEETAVHSVGGELTFTDDITFSSTNLINRHMPVFPKELSDYLTNFSSRHSSSDVLRYLENARGLKVLVIGETIIDEYLYCQTLGKTGKEPILAARHVGSEKFAGGIVAVANNSAAFCDHVSMLTFLGRADSQEDFVREKLDPRVDEMFLYQEDAPTIVKRRFVEVYPFQKLFELYVMDDRDTKPADSEKLRAKLSQILPEYDAVIVTDYGHGMLGPEEVEILCKQARFLAVNTQVNAGNLGFNTVSKYQRADFICISENEMRLEARNRSRELREIVLDVGAKLSCERMLITRGQEGCLCYSKDEGFFEIPALVIQAVDRMGAGDALFSISSLCVAQGAPIEVAGFIGNAVGAEAVATVGHRSSVQQVPLFKHIESLMK
jgi:rfaE bifunctional protein kinase chain/domain/rfaE bifunctional protein nucleotidyltransferase chain/domain